MAAIGTHRIRNEPRSFRRSLASILVYVVKQVWFERLRVGELAARDPRIRRTIAKPALSKTIYETVASFCRGSLNIARIGGIVVGWSTLDLGAWRQTAIVEESAPKRDPDDGPGPPSRPRRLRRQATQARRGFAPRASKITGPNNETGRNGLRKPPGHRHEFIRCWRRFASTTGAHHGSKRPALATTSTFLSLVGRRHTRAGSGSTELVPEGRSRCSRFSGMAARLAMRCDPRSESWKRQKTCLHHLSRGP